MPAASYMVTAANHNANAKIDEPMPSTKAMPVASELTAAECEEGIPPIDVSARKLILRRQNRSMKNFEICAIAHARADACKM